MPDGSERQGHSWYRIRRSGQDSRDLEQSFRASPQRFRLVHDEFGMDPREDEGLQEGIQRAVQDGWLAW